MSGMMGDCHVPFKPVQYSISNSDEKEFVRFENSSVLYIGPLTENRQRDWSGSGAHCMKMKILYMSQKN
eukprot:COSAG01_NODE_56007_length_321_cov_0.914414_1_plen_68_part_10